MSEDRHTRSAKGPRVWQRPVRRAAGLLAGIVMFFLACATDPTAPVIVIEFDGETTIVVGTTIFPSYSITVDGRSAAQSIVNVVSSNPSVISTAPNGDSVTAHARGEATLTITLVGSALGDTPPMMDTLVRAVADTVEIVQGSVLLESLNDSTSLSVIALSANNDTLPNPNPTWMTTDATVVTVSTTGVLTARRNGSVPVWGFLDDDSASVNVTVAQKLTDYELDPSPALLGALGATVTVTPTPRDAGGSEIPAGEAPVPEWESADPTIASVNTTTGVVTAVTNGETHVRARFTAAAEDDNVVDSTRVVVRQIATSVQILGPNQVSLTAVGDEIQLNALAFDVEGVGVRVATPTWSTQTPEELEIVLVEAETGSVRALSVGSAVVIAELDGASDEITVTVTDVPTSLRISPDTLRFSSVNDQVAVQPTVRNSRDAVLSDIPITWATTDSSIATPDSDGVVTAVAVGSTVLIGTLDNGVLDSAGIVVADLPVNVSIVPLDTTLASVDDEFTPEAEITNSRGDPLALSSVTWTSRDPAVAEARESGLIIARGAGQTFVVAENPLNAADRDSMLVIVTNAPASVSLDQTANTLIAVGRKQDYIATARNARGGIIENQEFVWTTDPGGVATITQTGLFTAEATAEAVGTTEVRATAGTGVGAPFGTATLEVLNTVTSISVSAPSNDIASLGATMQLSAVTTNTDGGQVTGVPIDWMSSNDLIATVTPGGLVEGVAVGTVTIIATVQGDTLTDSVDLSVTNGPQTINILSDVDTLLSIDDTVSPPVTLENARGVALPRDAADWTSTNPTVAQVSPNGLVTALGRGTAIIRASSPIPGAAVTPDEIAITVTNAPASIDVDPDMFTVASVDRTKEFLVEVRNARGDLIVNETVVWTTSDPTKASVDDDGLAIPVDSGSVYIRAFAEDLIGTGESVIDSALLIIENSASEITVSPNPVTLTSGGETQPLTAIVRNEAGSEITNAVVTWMSDDPGIADVDVNGLVTAVDVGTTVITATSESVSAEVSVTVLNDPATIDILETDRTLASVGDTVATAIDFRNGEGDPLPAEAANWSSSNEAVATVADNGVVTAVGRGTTTITAVSPAGATINDSFDVTVTNAPVTITLNSTAVTLTSLLNTFTFTAEVRNLAGNIIPGETITWSSGGAAAEINQAGVVTAVAVAPGGVTITADAGTPVTATETATVTITNFAVSIDVTPGSATIFDLGDTFTLSAVALNDRGDAVPAADISWSSSNPTAADVPADDGVVVATAVAGNVGTTNITASVDGGGLGTLTDVATVTVVNAPTSIAITPAAATLESIGEVLDVGAVTTIMNAGGAVLGADEVSWSSTATNIVEVDDNGVATARAAGMATVTATSPFDGTISDNVVITVTNDPVDVILTPSTLTLTAIGRNAPITAVVRNAAGDPIPGVALTWTVETGAGDISVDGTGVITALDVTGGTSGVVRAAVTADPTVFAEVDPIDVTNAAATVTLPPTVNITSVGGVTIITAVARNDLGAVITDPTTAWISDNAPDIAVVGAADPNSAMGTITGNAVGTATVTAMVDGVIGTTDVTVTNDLAAIDFPPTGGGATDVDLTSLQETFDLYTTTVAVPARFANGLGAAMPATAADWTSDNSSIASVSSSGVITAQGVGTTTVRATSKADGGVTDAVTVNVTNVADAITLDRGDATLTAIGQQITYTATVTNALGAEIVGATVNWDIPTANGDVSVSPGTGASTTVTGLAVGSDDIRATSGTPTATATVTVTDGTEIYVDKDVPGTIQHGSEEFPYTSITAGVNAVASGGTVLVSAATTPYNETVSIFNPVTIQGRDTVAAGCVTDFCSSPLSLPRVTANGPSGIINSSSSVAINLRHLSIVNALDVPAVSLSGAAEVHVDYVHVNPNGPSGATGNGIVLTNSTAGTRVTRSIVRDVKGYGIRLDNVAAVEVDTNIVTGVEAAAPDAGAAIDVVSATGEVTIRENEIARNEIGIDGAGITSGLVMSGNDIFDNIAAGAVEMPNDPDALISWWGDNTGPTTDDDDTPNSVGDSLLYAGTAPAFAGFEIDPNLPSGGVFAIVKKYLLDPGTSLSIALPDTTLVTPASGAATVAVRIVDVLGRPVDNVLVEACFVNDANVEDADEIDGDPFDGADPDSSNCDVENGPSKTTDTDGVATFDVDLMGSGGAERTIVIRFATVLTINYLIQ